MEWKICDCIRVGLLAYKYNLAFGVTFDLSTLRTCVFDPIDVFSCDTASLYVSILLLKLYRSFAPIAANLQRFCIDYVKQGRLMTRFHLNPRSM
jgi:hypothetical protein